MHTDEFQRFLKYCFLCLFTVCLAGCITTLPANKLPTTQEAFRKPPAQLHAEYPVIAEYDTTFKGFSKIKFTTLGANQLISAWGEPDNKRNKWSYFGHMGAALTGCGFLFGPVPAVITAGMVFAIRPYPPEYYYWRKDDYCIEAIFDHIFVNGYSENLVYWKWHQMSAEKDVPTECSKQIPKGQTQL